MVLNHGYQFAAQALPTPTNTPYDSPTTNMSRQPSCQGSTSPLASHSPATIPLSEDSYFPKQKGSTEDGHSEMASVHESRRFTPNNLGISLIAQIHSLKKELGSKNNMVESLEEGLHSSRAENERLTKDLKSQSVEVTFVKKQMQSLESDMLRALEDVVKEKDNAVENLADTRKRLEESRKKSRAQEEDINKAHAILEKEREDWEDKRRKMEGRIHTVEERLKAMVAEMLVVQSASQSKPELDNDTDEDARKTWFGDGNDDSHVRATSRLSDGSLKEVYDGKAVSNFRSSRMSGLHGLGGSQMSGLSLAEELELGEDGIAVKEQEDGQDALPEETYSLVKRYSEDKNHRNVMVYNVDQNEEHVGDESSGQHSIGIINDYIDIPENQPRYTDTGTQVTPPPSPTLQVQEPGISGRHVEQTERTANQSRKRIAIPQIFVEQTPALKALEPKAVEQKAFSVTSTSSQTVRQPEDHVLMPKATKVTSFPVPAMALEMISESTQTTEDPTPALQSASFRALPSATEVPVIAIHPPASRPSSSRNSVMLPPRTRNAACQVALEPLRNIKSTSMQTEEMRNGEQPVNIPLDVPPGLASFDQSSQPPLQLTEGRKQAENVLGLESLRDIPWGSPPVTAAEKEPSATNDGIRNAYFGKNDDGPLNDKQRSGPRRPIRSGSILAGFDHSSENDTANAQEYFSDDKLLNSPPIRKTLSKVQNSWRLVPHVEDSVSGRLDSAPEGTKDEEYVGVPNAAIAKSKASSQVTSKTCQVGTMGGSRKASSSVEQPDVRRKAFISNGTEECAQRDRSPGRPDFLGDLGEEPTVAPPFPVPTRSSSRNITLSASDGAASPNQDTTTFFRGQHYGRPLAKPKTLRKVQSAAAVAQPPMPYRPQLLQSFSASSTLPPSPKSPAPRRNQFILPYDSVVELESNAAQPRTRIGETAVETTGEETTVVDAIAQTMVGEWMWKYVRKRTSFGITERPHPEFDVGRNGETGNSNGVRHKRWVWLAPFERSVIWSSKQPTSGPALLGKGGRKLAIQSVLDVKDDTPPPKNAGSQAIFDRSILILTPHRALKFTATSQERHYTWLNALSFLSHPPSGMDDLASPPPLPKQEHQHLPSPELMAGFCRMPIQKPINLAKVKARPSIGSHSYSSPIGSIEQEIIEGANLPWEQDEAESDSAVEPPQVHRIAANARKRSSTGPRPVPLSVFHSYPNNSMATASSSSLRVATSREKYDRYTPHEQSGLSACCTYGVLPRRITQSNIALPPVVPNNFYDTAGTVRMEAFVDTTENDYVLSTRSKNYGATRGRKKGMSFWGLDASATSSRLESARPYGDDPFTGF